MATETIEQKLEETSSLLEETTKQTQNAKAARKSRKESKKEQDLLERETRLLRSFFAQKAMAVALKTAKETERILSEGTLSSVEKALRNLFDRASENYSFITLVDENGLSVVHSDRLREDVVYNDSVGLRSARTSTPITQIYYRDTGETMIDATVPIFINGIKTYALRLGARIQKESFKRKVYLYLLATVMVPAILFGIIARPPLYLVGWPIISGIGVLIFAWWLNRRITATIKEVTQTTRSISRGKLDTFTHPSTQDELSGLVLEVNRVNRGLHSIMNLLITVSGSLQNFSQGQALATINVGKNTKTIREVAEGFADSLAEQKHMIESSVKLENSIVKIISEINRNEFSVVQNIKRASERADESTTAIENARMQMEMIERIVKNSTEVIHELEDNTLRINKITNSITSIASKTNILALNAAIEASRAGEQGEGFAVVAEEVRLLAEESTSSAHEILEIVKETQVKANEAVMSMEKETAQVRQGAKAMIQTASVIGEMNESVDTATGIADENYKLSENLKEQNTLLHNNLNEIGDMAQKLSTVVFEILRSVREQATGTEEVASSAGSLARMASEINHVVNRFSIKEK